MTLKSTRSLLFPFWPLSWHPVCLSMAIQIFFLGQSSLVISLDIIECVCKKHPKCNRCQGGGIPNIANSSRVWGRKTFTQREDTGTCSRQRQQTDSLLSQGWGWRSGKLEDNYGEGDTGGAVDGGRWTTHGAREAGQLGKPRIQSLLNCRVFWSLWRWLIGPQRLCNKSWSGSELVEPGHSRQFCYTSLF